MEKERIAFAFIAKDKADIIERMLNSTKGVFDIYCLQDTGSKDNTIEIFVNWCKENKKEYYIDKKQVGIDYKETIVDGKSTLAEFYKARNDSFSLIPEGVEWAFWCDTDDIIHNPEQIPQLKDWAIQQQIDEVILPYDYAQPVDGIRPLTQKRERLISLKKKGSWHNWVHENYQIEGQIKIAFLEQTPFQIYIEHLRTPFESLATNRRNKQIMLMQLEEEGIDKLSEEMIHHLAFDCWEHKEWEESIKYYLLLLSRWEGKQISIEAVYQTFIKIAQAYFNQGKIDDAIKFTLKAIAIEANLADGYLLMAQIYEKINNWDEVEHYADKVLKLGIPKTTSPISEFDYKITPLIFKVQALLRRNNLKDADEIMMQLKQMMPSNPAFKQQHTMIKGDSIRQEAILGIDSLKRYYQSTNKATYLDRLRAAIPIELKDDDNVRRIIKEALHDEKHKKIKVKFTEDYKKTIVFYAGEGYEPWDGESDIKKGIGGSEGMCIQMARELAALGNNVIVYNSCGESDGKVFDGVTYIDFKKWDSSSKSDIFIDLRRPDILNRIIKSTKIGLWLHDTEYGDYPLSTLYSVNWIIVLSEFHKEIIKLNQGISDDKIFTISRNAVNAKALEYANEKAGKRDPYKLIYASSYDRGLDNLLSIWPQIKRAIPQATLDIYYGTVTMDKMIEMYAQVNPQISNAMRANKSRLFEMISKSEGVRELGRISQNELYKKFKEAGLWVYPTQFQEISCITAMQAQTLGAIPICTPVAALNETVNSKFGIKVNLDEFANAVIYALKHPEEIESKRQPMMEWAREAYDIKSLAKEWNLLFNEK